MSEILYIFESLGSTVFLVAAILCFVVGAIGFKYDKLSVIVVSLLLGIGAGYFMSMAAWDSGIGTIYIGSCVGLLSLLVSMKVRPVKRFFLGGVTVFLSVAAIAVIVLNAACGTSVTYSFQALNEDGIYQDVAIDARQSDLKKEFAAIIGCDTDDVKVKLNESKTQAVVDMPSANMTTLKAYGEDLVDAHEELKKAEVTSNSSWWTVALIIGAVCGIATGVLVQFKKWEKLIQIIGTSLFAGVYGATFAYLGLGDISPLIVAPLLALAAFFLQQHLNAKKESDVTEDDVVVPAV